jgi:hypothetical protein
MSICYISLTCEKYFDTRATWQKTYCKLPNLYYLSHKMDPKNNVYGWVDETGDDYNSCPLKYISFFKNVDLDYDWYVFIDDDAFVFHERMVKELEQHNPSEALYIGNPLFHLHPLVFMSGGAGFILSKPTYQSLKEYVRKTDLETLRKGRDMWAGDVSVGQWIRNIGDDSIKLVANHNLCFEHFDTRDSHFKRMTGKNPDVTRNSTLHYMKTEDDFAYLSSCV